jgi:hypothetical protein
MNSWILILFAAYANNATAAVRVGFDSQITCVAAAKEVADKIKASNPDAKIDWSCVKQ